MKNISDSDLLTLNFSKTNSDDTILWLLGSYLEETWRVHKQGLWSMKKERIFGFLRYKYKKDQCGARVQLSDIPELKL